jgi:transposase InsO family protein
MLRMVHERDQWHGELEAPIFRCMPYVVSRGAKAGSDCTPERRMDSSAIHRSLRLGMESKLHDRDRVYGEIFTRRLRAMGIRDRPTAPRSPWQNGHTERLIGSIRRECLDHVVVFGERHLRHLLLILYSVTMAREHTFP